MQYHAPFRARPVFICVPGATRFALAPGFHISRLWRCISRGTLKLLLAALVAGVILLFLSYYYLFRIFKSRAA